MSHNWPSLVQKERKVVKGIMVMSPFTYTPPGGVLQLVLYNWWYQNKEGRQSVGNGLKECHKEVIRLSLICVINAIWIHLFLQDWIRMSSHTTRRRKNIYTSGERGPLNIVGTKHSWIDTGVRPSCGFRLWSSSQSALAAWNVFFSCLLLCIWYVIG